MTNRWCDAGITKLIYDDIRAYEKTSGDSETLR